MIEKLQRILIFDGHAMLKAGLRALLAEDRISRFSLKQTRFAKWFVPIASWHHICR